MDIQKVVNIINQIKEIPILNDSNIKNGDFSTLDSRSSVHYILYPLLSFLGYNVFNPAEVKVNDGKDIVILEGNTELIKINLMDFDKEYYIEYDVLKNSKENVKLQIWTTGIYYKLYSRKEKIIEFDIRKLDKINIELVLKILLKESLIDSINNEKFFDELLIESKFGNLRKSSYVRDVLYRELTNPSNELIDILIDNIYEKYCDKMDKNIFKEKLTEELNLNKGSLLDLFKVNNEELEKVEDAFPESEKELIFKDVERSVIENDPYLSLDVLEDMGKTKDTSEEYGYTGESYEEAPFTLNLAGSDLGSGGTEDTEDELIVEDIKEDNEEREDDDLKELLEGY